VPDHALGAQRSAKSYDLSSSPAHECRFTRRHTGLDWQTQGDVMNKDQVKGRVEEAKGKIKEVAGRTVGNPDLEDRGTVQKVGGTVQRNYGDLKEDVKDALKKQR
jgi:uncharacterized protein YjbJ (UPF0337 family)